MLYFSVFFLIRTLPPLSTLFPYTTLFRSVRTSDGDQSLNRYSVAGFVSRTALHEGTWQKYYYKNNERAQKFFELAIDAADYVISSGRYSISSEFRDLFISKDRKSVV